MDEAHGQRHNAPDKAPPSLQRNLRRHQGTGADSNIMSTDSSQVINPGPVEFIQNSIHLMPEDGIPPLGYPRHDGEESS